MRILSFLIRRDQLLYLDIFAKQNNLSRSDAIRYAIDSLNEEPITPAGFPMTPGVRLTRTSVRLTEQEISKLDKISKLSNLTISDVIRAAIYRLLMGAPKPQLPATTDQIEKKYGYKCPYCDSLFPTVRALKIHLTRAHNGFPWCPVCYKSLKGKNPTNHFRRFPDPYHQFWYSISRKRYLASRYQKRKEVVRK